LLPDGSTEVAQQVAVARANVLQGMSAIEVLRTGGQVDALRPIAAVAEVVRIVVVEHGMQDVDVDSAQAVDDLHQPVEADPGVVMDGNAEDLLDGGPRKRRA